MLDHDEFDNDETDEEDQTNATTAEQPKQKKGDIKLLRQRAERAAALEKENALLKLGVDTEQPQVQLFLEAKRDFDFSNLDNVKAEMTKYGIISDDADAGAGQQGQGQQPAPQAGAGQGHVDQETFMRLARASAGGAPIDGQAAVDYGQMHTEQEVIDAVIAAGGQVIYE